jgi:hypothetical protein
MRQCGADPAQEELVSATRRLLAPGVSLSLDLRHDERDVAETLEALKRVLPC